MLPLKKLVYGILLRNSKWWDQGPFIYNKGYKSIFPSVHQNIRDDGNKNICYFGTSTNWNMLWWILSKLLSKTKRHVLSNLWFISRNIFTFTYFVQWFLTGREHHWLTFFNINLFEPMKGWYLAKVGCKGCTEVANAGRAASYPTFVICQPFILQLS